MLKNVIPLTQDDEPKADWSEWHILAEKTLKRYNDAMLKGNHREALHLALDLVEIAHKLKSGALDLIWKPSSLR